MPELFHSFTFVRIEREPLNLLRDFNLEQLPEDTVGVDRRVIGRRKLRLYKMIRRGLVEYGLPSAKEGRVYLRVPGESVESKQSKTSSLYILFHLSFGRLQVRRRTCRVQTCRSPYRACSLVDITPDPS